LEHAFQKQAESQETLQEINFNTIDVSAVPPQEEDRAGLVRRFEPPRTPTEEALSAIWSKTLSVGRVGRNDNFFHLGGKSLDALKLFTEVEREFGRRLPVSTLLQAPTLELLANVLQDDNWKPNWSSLVTIQAEEAKPPLFLVHAAEGNVLVYRNLARYLGADQPVYGLQSQGLNGSGRFLTRMEDMAAHYVREIRSLQSEGPYYLGGYCLGGIVALEMAQQLRAQGEQVALVAMIETYNERVSPMTQSFLISLFHSLQNVGYHLSNFLILKGSERWRFLNEKWVVEKGRLGIRLATWANKLKGMLGSNNGHSYPHLLIKKANEHATYEYLPKAYSGRAVVFRPKTFFQGQNDPEFGWGEIVRSGLAVRKLPLYPKAMLVEPFVQTLAEELKACLEEARKEHSALSGERRADDRRQMTDGGRRNEDDGRQGFWVLLERNI
jgi:thioesterase domain-containing protein/acyl carrier protein